jgi:hypothetical protein
MTNVRRKLFNLATAISLVLCVATVVLWVRSYWRHDLVWCTLYPSGYNSFWSDNPPDYIFASLRGEMMVGPEGATIASWRAHPRLDWIWVARTFPEGDHRGYLNRYQNPILARFGLGYSNPANGYWYVVFPHWFIATITALLPTCWLIRRLAARRRTKAGRCPVCGYDLRATPERCPECGRLADSAAR